MAGPLRIEFAGVLYHATSRDDRREPIFEDDEDRLMFLATLAFEITEHFGLHPATVGRIIRARMLQGETWPRTVREY